MQGYQTAPRSDRSARYKIYLGIDELFELHAHLARELLRLGDVLACLALQAVARTPIVKPCS
jgi:hypothetical protein